MERFRVLIVEDDLINAKLLHEFLRMKGYDVLDVLQSGEQAIQFVKKQKPDLIFMDIQLKGDLTGIEATEIINKETHIPILYLTSHTDKEVIQRARETQPVGYVVKPFSPLQLEVSLEMARKKILADEELENYQHYLENLVVSRTKELIEEVKKHKDARIQSNESKIKLKAITEAANDAIVLFNEYGQIKFWNKAAELMFQYPEDEILDQNIRILFSSDSHDEDFSRAMEVIQFAIDQNVLSDNLEFTGTKRDGTEIPVEMSLASVDIEEEQLIISIVRDISQRKRDLEEISRFKLISDIANYGLAITDAQGDFLYINKYFSDLLEYEQDEIMGKSFFMITPHIKQADIALFVRESAQIHGGEGREITLMTHSQQKIPVMLNSVTVRDKYNHPKFYAVSAIDIRERKEYEENLLKAKRLAEESDKLKTSFLSTISHELRTPLNAIIGFSELIRLQDVDMEEVKEFNEEVYQSGNHLLSIVEDILDVSMLEGKNLKISPVEFSLNNLMKKIFDKFKSNQRYDNSNIDLRWKSNKEDGQDKFFSDNSKLEQILTKLLDNAYKFSHKGIIEFGYVYHEADQCYDFYVRDQGKGIKKARLSDIFDSFKQVDHTENRAHDGLGLGLSIVNQLLELMKGEIFVKSKINKGSEFTFRIKQS